MSNQMTNETLVREFYQQFHARNREAFVSMMHPDFTFTSPYDDRIDTAAYFERCWPNGDVITDFAIDRTAADNSYVFIHYSAKGKSGQPFDNTELFTIEDGKVLSVQVFFGQPTTQADKLQAA